MPRPTFPDHRCPSRRGERRCQLLDGHDGAHARVPAGQAPPICQRWDDDREWIDPGDGLGSLTEHRLRWVACGYSD